MTDLLRPDTAPVPARLFVSGYVCVDVDGHAYWLTARKTAAESLEAAFGRTAPHQLDLFARKGWRCVPITLAAPAPHPTNPPSDGKDWNAIASERHDAEMRARVERGEGER